MAAQTWCVYKHTSPSGKVYIGITSHKNPKYRFGKNGSYYDKRTIFGKAIKKYGWDNFTHETLFTGLTKEQAQNKEIELIKYYKDLGTSYNMTVGGEGHNFGKKSHTPEYRTKWSQKYRKEHPEIDRIQYIRHHDKKISAARKYYKENREKVLTYKRTEAVKAKARERAKAWRLKHPDYMKNYMKEYNKSKRKSNE